MSRPRNPHEEDLREHILRGGSLKTFPLLPVSTAAKCANRLGFKRYYLTEIEAAHIRFLRQANMQPIPMPAPESKSQIGNRLAHERRVTWKNLWSRTDTMRWLDERTAIGLVWLQLKERADQPRRLKNWGAWMMVNRLGDFNHVHAILTSATDREAVKFEDALP